MRQIKSEHEKAAYIQDLEHYQLQQKEIGMMTLNLANRSLESISLILEPIYQALKASGGVIPRDKIDLLFTSQLAAKNLILAATSGAELTAKGLEIEHLLELIECEIDARSR
jgi:thymidine phosphorylase